LQLLPDRYSCLTNICVTDCTEEFKAGGVEMPVYLCGRYSLVQSCGSSTVPDGALLPAEAYISFPSVQQHRNWTKVAQTKDHGSKHL